MNSQYCKIGKTVSPTNGKNLNELEVKYRNFVEEAYNVKQTDASLSDILYFEASKLRQRILRLKASLSNNYSDNIAAI
jgi:hypothetical protein